MAVMVLIRGQSISNRRMYSSRNAKLGGWLTTREHIESENVLKPELRMSMDFSMWGAYRIGECTQAGTAVRPMRARQLSISNRRMYSSRNYRTRFSGYYGEHIESENVLKPERPGRLRASGSGAYRIGECTQAGTTFGPTGFIVASISNRRMYSSRNEDLDKLRKTLEHIESENVLKPERRGAH